MNMSACVSSDAVSDGGWWCQDSEWLQEWRCMHEVGVQTQAAGSGACQSPLTTPTEDDDEILSLCTPNR
jgi:hypothetical protein